MNPPPNESYEQGKQDLVNRYLAEQYTEQQHAMIAAAPSVSSRSQSDVPSNITLDQFKELVKKWFELDNFIKKGQETLREKKRARTKLGDVIQNFMQKYDIEDLNTKEGRIRCKTRKVKQPISASSIKQKITDLFAHDTNTKDMVLTKIYNEERPMVEKVSLRRLKISGAN
jgi:hypothetical protein